MFRFCSYAKLYKVINSGAAAGDGLSSGYHVGSWPAVSSGDLTGDPYLPTLFPPSPKIQVPSWPADLRLAAVQPASFQIANLPAALTSIGSFPAPPVPSFGGPDDFGEATVEGFGDVDYDGDDAVPAASPAAASPSGSGLKSIKISDIALASGSPASAAGLPTFGGPDAFGEAVVTGFSDVDYDLGDVQGSVPATSLPKGLQVANLPLGGLSLQQSVAASGSSAASNDIYKKFAAAAALKNAGDLTGIPSGVAAQALPGNLPAALGAAALNRPQLTNTLSDQTTGQLKLGAGQLPPGALSQIRQNAALAAARPQRRPPLPPAAPLNSVDALLGPIVAQKLGLVGTIVSTKQGLANAIVAQKLGLAGAVVSTKLGLAGAVVSAKQAVVDTIVSQKLGLLRAVLAQTQGLLKVLSG